MIIDIIIILLLYIYLFRSIRSYSREKGLNFHEFFVIERIVLASAFLFGIIELYIASIVLFFSLLITIISQILLRKRYEFKMK
jgi:hypothetical protein